MPMWYPAGGKSVDRGPDMAGIRRASRITLWLLALSLVVPPVSSAKIYKYVDPDGNIHFVDDESLIPPECRPDSRTYSEPEDDLTPSERAKLKAVREREREEDEARRRAQERKKAREAYLKSLETPVVIRGNQVLVPVEVGYGGRKAGLTLLLDTGASRTLIYRHAVASLEIDQPEKTVSRVAGGLLVKTYRARLRYLKVGPWEAEDVEVALMDHVGPAADEHGLLGMDFLSRRDYRIDYEKQLIRWAEPKKDPRE